MFQLFKWGKSSIQVVNVTNKMAVRQVDIKYWVSSNRVLLTSSDQVVSE